MCQPLLLKLFPSIYWIATWPEFCRFWKTTLCFNLLISFHGHVLKSSHHQTNLEFVTVNLSQKRSSTLNCRVWNHESALLNIAYYPRPTKHVLQQYCFSSPHTAENTSPLSNFILPTQQICTCFQKSVNPHHNYALYFCFFTSFLMDTILHSTNGHRIAVLVSEVRQQHFFCEELLP